MKTLISCRNLRVVFGDFVAVEDINLDVDKGAICVLLGPNGAGKTSTIKTLSGLLQPTSGDVVIAGHNMNSYSDEVKRTMGVLPDDLGLFDSLTVGEHLSLTSEVYGLAPDTARRRIDELLRVLALQQGIDTFMSACSHGMRKKTSLAMAILPNPAVLLLDEPFEGVDPVTSAAICDLLTYASQRGTTVLLTTHALAIAERIATQLVVMREGKIVWNTPASDLRKPLEEHYFALLGVSSDTGLKWLGSAQF